jgi:hypothetical protein
MRNPRLFRWRNVENTIGLLLVAQRIEEALFDYTFDSYKVPALNTHTRAYELSQTLNDVAAGRQRGRALEAIVEELAWSVHEDIATTAVLGPLANKYSDPAWWDVKTPAKLRAQVDTLMGALASRIYEDQLILEISSRLNEAKRKEDLYSLTTNLVGEWLRKGFSKEYVFYATRAFFFSPSGPDIDSNKLFQRFTETFRSKKKKYCVVLRGSLAIAVLKDAIPKEVAAIHSAAPAPRSKSQKERKFLDERHDGVFVTFPEVEAVDASSARALAVRILSSITEVVACHVHRDSMPIDAAALVYQNDETTVLKASPLSVHKHYECAARELPAAFSRTLRALGRQQSHEDSQERFRAALGLHASAVSSQDSAVHLTSLWAALEALLPIGAEDVKITAVMHTLVPILCRHYPMRLVAELENDLARCAPEALANSRSLVPSEVPAELQFAAIVSIAALEPARDLLYVALARNPLLKHRLYHVKKSTESAKYVLETVAAHRRKVEWQIRRIYRSRNLLVHAGRTLPYLPTIVENLHAYLHIVLEGIEDRFAYMPPKNLNAALLSIKLEADAHAAYLEAQGDAATTRDNLLAVLAGPVLGAEHKRSKTTNRVADMLATWGRRTAF